MAYDEATAVDEFYVLRTIHIPEHRCGHDDCPHATDGPMVKQRAWVSAETPERAVEKAKKLPGGAWQDVDA